MRKVLSYLTAGIMYLSFNIGCKEESNLSSLPSLNKDVQVRGSYGEIFKREGDDCVHTYSPTSSIRVCVYNSRRIVVDFYNGDREKLEDKTIDTSINSENVLHLVKDFNQKKRLLDLITPPNK